MSALLLVVLLTCACGGKGRDAEMIERPTPEDRAALDYLNRIRANPGAFSAEIGVDLSGIAQQPALKWNAMLTRSARVRAEDMAKRNYFAHVNPDGVGPNFFAQQAGYKFPAWWGNAVNANNIESIFTTRSSANSPRFAANATGTSGIRSLIRDDGVNPPGHRQHLLGMTKFDAAFKDVGFGAARVDSGRFQYYLVVHTGVTE